MASKLAKKSPAKVDTRTYREHLPPLKFYGSEFVLNTESGMFYRVSSTAILLLQAMEQGADSDGLIDIVQRHCLVSRPTAVRDVELLVNELSVRGILMPRSTKRKS